MLFSWKVINRMSIFNFTIWDSKEFLISFCVNFNSAKTNVIMGNNTKCIYGNEYIEEKILDKLLFLTY